MVVSCDRILSLLWIQTVYKVYGENLSQSQPFDGNPFITCQKKPFKNIQTQRTNSLPVRQHVKAQHCASAFNLFPPPLYSIHNISNISLVPCCRCHFIYSLFHSSVKFFNYVFSFVILFTVVASAVAVASFFNSLMVHWIIELTVCSFQYTKVSNIRFHLVDCWNEKSARVNCAKICYPWKRKSIDFFSFCSKLICLQFTEILANAPRYAATTSLPFFLYRSHQIVVFYFRHRMLNQIMKKREATNNHRNQQHHQQQQH